MRRSTPTLARQHVVGGRTVYGHELGVLMLDTTFPRPVGDIGNALTWPFPVLYRVVHGAVPQKVLSASDQTMLDPFVHAARELVDAGVRAITTSCGYLAVYQRELSASVEVPVLTSSLLQVPLAARTLGEGRRVGIITVRDMLTEQHFRGVGWTSEEIDVVVRAVDPESTFARLHAPLGEPEPVETDAERMRDEVVATAVQLVQDDPTVGALVMECTNLVPYSQAVRAATGLPVLDHYTLVMHAYRALAGHEFAS